MTVVIAMLAAMLLGLPAMIFHECGHVAAARVCRVKVKQVGISWVGLFVKREPGPRWANVLISFSGPFVNLLLASVLWNAIPSFAQVNLFIGVGSLLPLPKSDGKRILALLLPTREETGWSNQQSIVSASQSQAGVGAGSL